MDDSTEVSAAPPTDDGHLAKPEPAPERERRTWPLDEAELDACEAAEEALAAAELVWNQANARHDGRVRRALNRTQKKADDMPEVNLARGAAFFLVGRKGDKWEEVFENEIQRS